MKKWPLFLLIIIIICFSGCGNGKQTNSDPSNQNNQKTLREDKEAIETEEKEENKEKNQNAKTEQTSTVEMEKSEEGEKETESTSSNEASVNNNRTEPVAEDNRPYLGIEANCSVCGADGRDVYISREGMCDSCFQKMYPDGLYGRCTVCGVELTNGEAIAHGDRCDNCAKCDVCGTPMNDTSETGSWTCYNCYCASASCPICGTIGIMPATGLCYNCSYGDIGNCPTCGNPLNIDGSCDICYPPYGTTSIPEEEIYANPIICPYCSYSWYEMGVGTDGVWCPSCGQNFMP